MKLTYNKIEYDYNEVFSFKDFTNRTNIELSGVVYASCFSQETPDNQIFVAGMTGVTFIKCNLDNVSIPDGNTVIDCSQKRFKVQNDLNDWIIDTANNPVEPVNAKIFVKLGLPIPKPEDIPVIKVDKVIDLLEKAKIESVKAIK